jgi:hypothetical protein
MGGRGGGRGWGRVDVGGKLGQGHGVGLHAQGLGMGHHHGSLVTRMHGSWGVGRGWGHLIEGEHAVDRHLPTPHAHRHTRAPRPAAPLRAESFPWSNLVVKRWSNLVVKRWSNLEVSRLDPVVKRWSKLPGPMARQGSGVAGDLEAAVASHTPAALATRVAVASHTAAAGMLLAGDLEAAVGYMRCSRGRAWGTLRRPSAIHLKMSPER